MDRQTAAARMSAGDHVHPFQPEVRGCGQDVAIVRVDFGEAVRAGANQVQGMRGTDKDSGGKRPVGAEAWKWGYVQFCRIGSHVQSSDSWRLSCNGWAVSSQLRTVTGFRDAGSFGILELDELPDDFR